MSDQVWHDYRKVKPPRDGQYLWVINNWRAMNLQGEPVHQYKIALCEWSYKWMTWRNGNEHFMDPDQWAECPRPEPALQPISIYEGAGI